MRRLVTLSLAVVLMAVALPALGATEPIYFYPDVDGYPSASLKTTSPTYSGPMLDIDDNGKQGRRVDKSDKGLTETDTRKYQQWSAPVGGLEITGAATLTIWFADKSFNGGDTNRLVAYLLDCGSSSCNTLAAASKDVAPPDGENVFKETTLTFPSFDHTFASGRTLRLRIMIDRDFSDDDMTFAYDTTNYVTRVKLNKVVPPPTTTTTSTTTTSTTTTTLPTTTTTKATTTTTKTATTTTKPSTSTTNSSVTSTTSTTNAPTSSVGAETTTSTTVGETTSTTQFAVSPGPSTTLPGPPPPPELQDLDTEKVNLVIRTTPAQRGILVSSPTVELSPVQGLMVTFVSAAETVKSNLLSSAGLGLIMASLLVIGMSRRRRSEEPVRTTRTS